ncbi:hypothetical protein CFIICLFH_0639 [Methylobacterium goesingense]|uniref:Cytochrome bd-type quinol oxidase subunit 2 n=1 Tax=Methylobacterium goesingense TaxID=243690 RepID=A0ABV2L8P1_9HYPH|nr:hypothetical protein CFIICLFH_0639 [Methylobacterium goesingense]
MLIAPIFRSVAFEFRFKANRSQFVWDNAFHYGFLVATFAQGMVLGAFVQGFQIEGRSFTGGTLDWLTIWQAANAVFMPLALADTAYAGWVFRGKVAEDIGSGGYGP